MDIVVFTPVRLFADGLNACFSDRACIRVRATVSSFTALREVLSTNRVDLALIDVTSGVDLEEIRNIAEQYPAVLLVALGLLEQRQQVIRCGRAGFSGYVARNASVDSLCASLTDVVAGRLACPAEISGGLLRALFRKNDTPPPARADPLLTRREAEVLQFIARGCSNKEIARKLNLSVATVKHHVHNVLEKLNVSRRSEAVCCAHDSPWLATALSGEAQEFSFNGQPRHSP